MLCRWTSSAPVAPLAFRPVPLLRDQKAYETLGRDGLDPKVRRRPRTPNPLNMKSRLRFLLFGTFYGFPHLVRMPAAGEHLHISPINLSFLISFAERYGFVLDRIHPVRITVKMYRFIIHCWMLKLYTLVKLLFKDHESRRVMQRLVTLNVLLNDGIVVSLRKQ